MIVLENEKERIVHSTDYNTYFNKESGFFARWGESKEDDPVKAPMPEIADIEISSGRCHNSCPFCFVPNTDIRTENDHKAIQNIHIGDKVLSYNETKKEIELKEVLEVYERDYEGELIIIEADLHNGATSKIECTPNHPIYTYNRGWVQAQDICADDEIEIINNTQTCRHCGKYIPRGKGYKRYICSEKCYNDNHNHFCRKCGKPMLSRNLLCSECYTCTPLAHYHPLFSTYSAMIQCCYNNKRNNYSYYGGKGINICEEWLHDFNKFVKDMGERPNGYTLDRIDGNKDYCKANCRWVTIEEQRINRNRFKNVQLKYKGVSTRPSGHFVAQVHYKGKEYYCGVFNTEEDAAIAYNEKVKELYGKKCLPQYLNEVIICE